MKIKETFDKVLNENYLISTAFGIWAATKFAILLKTPWIRWPAYKQNIINDKGDFVEEKDERQLDPFINLVRKIKKMMMRVVPDNSMLTTLVAMYLLTEDIQYDKELKRQIEDCLDNNEIAVLDNILQSLKEGIE